MDIRENQVVGTKARGELTCAKERAYVLLAQSTQST